MSQTIKGPGQIRALARTISKHMANQTYYKDAAPPKPSRQVLRRALRQPQPQLKGKRA